MRVCARVLAAALMAGAIGAALAFPARFGPGEMHPGALTAPPSTLHRTLHVPALPAPRPARAAIIRARSTGATIVAVHRDLVSQSHKIVTKPARRPRIATPATPPPVTRVLAAAVAPVSSATAASAAAERHPHGHAYGHDKAHGKPQQQPPPGPPSPASQPAPNGDGEELDVPSTPHDNGNGNGNGNGHAYGHAKGNAVGG